MNSKDLTGLSKFLSLVLRHNPAAAFVELDDNGWVDVDALLKGCERARKPLTRAVLELIVAEDNKQRYAFSPDGTRIRANQGHSVEVDLGLEPRTPPEFLYHGTASRFLEPIRREGLKPGSRQYVHLSTDIPTATAVGSRHGKPVILRVRSGDMARSGHKFYISANAVWLVDSVPAGFLDET